MLFKLEDPNDSPKKPAAPAVELPPLSEADQYRPVNGRQRLKIIGVTLLTVTVLWSLLLFKPGAHLRIFPDPAAQRPCPPGKTKGCVGGEAQVMLLPASPAPAASAAR